jgi:hypothetical protein
MLLSGVVRKLGQGLFSYVIGKWQRINEISFDDHQKKSNQDFM